MAGGNGCGAPAPGGGGAPAPPAPPMGHRGGGGSIIFSGEPRPAAGDIGEYPGLAPPLFAFALPFALALPVPALEGTPEGTADAAAAAMAAAAAGLPSIIIICGVGGVGSSLAFICNVLWTSMTA